MRERILPFLVKQSKEKLTDRGALAVVDEFMAAIGLLSEIGRRFPRPGSGRGMKAVEFIRTVIYHFVDGGRFLEEIGSVRNDKGFRKLVKMDRMPGPDAVGNWLRRMGNGGLTSGVDLCIDFLVKRYLRRSDRNMFTLDVDATIIESEKGDAVKSYKGIRGYHPMLAFLSDGTDGPICSSVKFRQGNASPQVDILEAIRHSGALIPEGKGIRYFRSDSAAYQARVVDHCNGHGIYYTVTADLDVSVLGAIRSIASRRWKSLHDRKDRFKTGREYAETVHTMNDSDHSFRLIVQREVVDEGCLFDCYGKYRYHCVITNVPSEEMTGEQVIWHHNGRGNAERFIRDVKYGVNLRYVPCGQFEANAMYFHLGIVAYNVIKLMQVLVLPETSSTRRIQSVRSSLLRMVAKVTTGSRCIWMQVNKTGGEIRQLLLIREKIYRLSLC